MELVDYYVSMLLLNLIIGSIMIGQKAWWCVYICSGSFIWSLVRYIELTF